MTMHTYRKVDDPDWAVWEVGYQHPNAAFVRLGPKFGLESEAAAFTCFLNGGRYSPGEIEPIFAVPVDEETDDEPEDHTTPPSKGNFADYPHEQTKKRQEVGTS